MSIQNVLTSTAAVNSQLLQQQDTGASSDFSGQSLPQLSTSQVQSLQQALQNDLQQALSTGTSNGSLQSQLDSSVSNTLQSAGFSQDQTNSVLDKLNQALTKGGRGRGGHGGHRAKQVFNSLIQALQNNATGQSTSSTSVTSTSNPSATTLLSAVTGSESTTSGQSLDVSA